MPKSRRGKRKRDPKQLWFIHKNGTNVEFHNATWLYLTEWQIKRIRELAEQMQGVPALWRNRYYYYENFIARPGADQYWMFPSKAKATNFWAYASYITQGGRI